MRLFSHPVNHFLATRRNLFRLRVVSRSVPLRERRTCLKAGVGVNQILLFLSVCCGTVGGAFPFIGHGRGFFRNVAKIPLTSLRQDFQNAHAGAVHLFLTRQFMLRPMPRPMLLRNPQRNP